MSIRIETIEAKSASVGAVTAARLAEENDDFDLPEGHYAITLSGDDAVYLIGTADELLRLAKRIEGAAQKIVVHAEEAGK